MFSQASEGMWDEPSLEFDPANDTFDAAEAVLARTLATLSNRVPMSVILEAPKSKEQNNTSRDDSMVMNKADALLSGGPPLSLPAGSSPMPFRPRAWPQPAETTASTIGRIEMTPTRTPSRHRISPKSALSTDVEKVIRYLDKFRFTPPGSNHATVHSTMMGKENSHLPSPKKLATRRESPSPLSDRFLSQTTSSEHINNISMEEIGKVQGIRTILRDTPKGPVPASIFLANSLHSSIQQQSSAKEVSFMHEETDNLIASMCVELSQKEGTKLDYAFLVKIQDKVEELLQETRKEREATHEWVKAVRASVENWVQEQRRLIQCEQKHAMERAAQRKPESEHLEQIIQQQAKKIEQLESKLVEKTRTRTPGLKAPRGHTIGSRRVETAPRGHTIGSRCVETAPRGHTIGSRRVETAARGHTIGSRRVETDESSFFAEMEKLDSPTLPHLPSNMARPTREYTTLVDGRRLVKFRNGTEREYVPDGTIITRYTNGDVKTQGGSGDCVIYWHAKEETMQTIHSNGLQVYEYPSGQVERHFPEGRKEVTFPNGDRRSLQGKKGEK